jgi:hypothetical protein
MAIYPFRCTVRACRKEQDHVIPTVEYIAGKRPFCDVETCRGKLKRLVTPVNEVGTGNRLHHHIDHGLSRGADPVVFNTRRDWEDAMKRNSVAVAERGMVQDRQRYLADRRQKAESENWKKLEPKADRAFEEALGKRKSMSDETARNVVGRIRDQAQTRAA